jgi:dienelactone hydrolase
MTRDMEIRLVADDQELEGSLRLPPRTAGLVLFAHGSGSSRFSPRNQQVARVLEEAGHGTLLMDLLTSEEESIDRRTAHLRFDIGLLASRVTAAIDWVLAHADLRHQPIGLFGASTGAAAALVAAAGRPTAVKAVVSRGGRPDLAADALSRVSAPTLLIVGGRDHEVLALNQSAMTALRRAHVELVVIAGATHLFEEAGALDQVAARAEAWFTRHLI